jgi:hypothetical protein
MDNLWSEIQEYQLEYPEDFGDSVSEEKLMEAESSMQIVFSDQYKKFICKYGAAGIGAYYVNGFFHLPLMGNSNWSVVDKTNFYKNDQKWPNIDDWYIISDDGRGNPIGCKPDGSVWLSDHDAGFEQVKLAGNFEEFLHKLLTDTLYE